MNKVLELIIINKITEFVEKNLLLSKLTMKVKKEKKNRNDFEIVDRKNAHSIKAEKKQNCHNYECKRDKNLESCFAHLTVSQFQKQFKLNDSMNKKFFQKRKLFITFEKETNKINNVNAEFSQNFLFDQYCIYSSTRIYWKYVNN